jgi:hypothetical protein
MLAAPHGAEPSVFSMACTYKIAFAAALVVLFSCPAAAGIAPAPSDALVVVPGALLPALSGERVDRIAAYAARGGALAPIPFQVDERDPLGRYVVDHRVQNAPPAELPKDDGRMDANDEAVFEEADAGDRVAPAAWPPHHAGEEVEIDDPVSGEKRYVYLFSVGAPPAVTRRDIRYEPSGSGRVLARGYALDFGAGPNIIRGLSIPREAGGTGVNLLRGTAHKLYSRLSPYLLSLRIKRDEGDVKAVVLGYREGPVRVIRLVQRHTPLVLGLSTPETVSTELYGAHQAQWRDEVGFSLDMKRLVARSVIEDRFKLSRAAAGDTFLCDGGGRVRLGRKGDGGRLPLDKARWWGITGPSGSFYVRYTLKGKAAQEILFSNGREGSAGWQLDVLSMKGRVLPLVTRMMVPSASNASDPLRLPGIGAPDPRVIARTAEEITGIRSTWFGPSGPPEPKRITRRYDVIELTGYGLKPFLGLPNDKLRLYAARGGKLEPIPFQVDERDGEGRFVLPQGKAKTVDVDGGRLDDNDEIVTMGDRLGDRVGRDAWPPKATHGAEVEVQDPVGGGSGWLYLFAFDIPPPASPERLVHMEGFDRVTSDVYKVGFPKGKAYFDLFEMKKAGRRAFSDNLVDHLKIRFRLTFSFLYIPLPYHARENDFGRETIAYREGAVRLILRQDLWANLTFGVVFHLEPSDWVFYEDQVVSEVIVKNPFLYGPGALKRVKNAHFLQTVDLDRRAAGMRFYNSNNARGVVIDGKMSEAEKHLDRRKDRWIAITGKQASSLVRIRFSDGLDPDRDLFYIDDKNKKDWNDRDYGQWGNAGYDVNLKAPGSVVLLTAPSYRLLLYFYLPPDFRMERLEEILEILDRPVRVRIRSGARASPGFRLSPRPSDKNRARAGTKAG